MIYSFSLVHRPVGKARARTITRGGRTWSYTPKNTVEFEQAVRAAIIKQCPIDHVSGNLTPMEGPVALGVTIRGDYIKVTVGQLDEKKYLTKRPDLLNIIKAIEDAGNGLLYLDDKQVAIIRAERRK